MAAASRTGKTDSPSYKTCGSPKKPGREGLCRRPAGWGTDHVGFGRCKLHGGCNPNGKTYATRERIAARAALAPQPIGGRQAIELVLAEDHAVFQAVRAEVDKLQAHEIIRRAELKPIVRLLQQVGQRLASTGKLAADAGIDERRVAVDEAVAAAVAQVIRAALTDLGVPLDERAHQVIALRLAEVQMAA